MGEENETLEFKKSTAELEAGLNSISAILNKHQKGILYFGVKNDGTPVGQDIGENTIRDITNAITSHIEPRIYPVVNKVVLNNKECIKVEFSGEEVPYFAYGRAYMRVGDEDKKLSQKELGNLFIKVSGIETKWEETETEYSFEEINESLLKKCIQQGNESQRISYKYTNKKDILNRLGLISKNGKLLNAGNALFGKNANIVLKMAIFASDTKATFLDITRKEGNILELGNIGENYIKEHIKWTPNFETGRVERLEIPEIPVASIREAIMNCLCHQSMISPEDAEISIYKDRIEIYNPGEFNDLYTPEDYIEGRGKSILRNKLIGNTLYLSHEIEAFGTGIRRIYEECNKNNVKVNFRKDKAGFTVIFYRKTDKELEKVATTIPKVLKESNMEKFEKFTKNEEKLLNELYENPNITQVELSQKLNISKRAIIKIIKKLKENGIIERIGSNRKGFWKINV